ncbi:MAG: hypothetical protein AAFZ87_18065 [Planctomycetota bacterium]
MRTGSPEQDAWHEAGHAIVAHALGGRVVELTLEADDERFEGRATVEWPAAPRRDAAARSGRVALAGPIAEMEQYGDEAPHEPAQLRAWEADWDEVERCAEVVCPDPDERSAWIERWFREVAELVRDPDVNERIARVADALDAHGTLDETLFEDCL